MKSNRVSLIRVIFTAMLICSMMVAMSLVAFAEENGQMLRDKGVDEINSAYEYTIHTGGDAVGASAGMSYGGWYSLGSKLSYMEFPEGVAAPNGESDLWCYCIDITTDTRDGHKYSVTTLDAAEYYEDSAAAKIRAILINSYPHLSVAELEDRFDLSDLTEEEAFIATQWIIWYYSNPNGLVEAGEDTYYPANIYKPSEYTRDTIRIWYDDADGNEVSAQSSNVVKLAKALDALEPVGAYTTDPAEIEIEKRVYEDKVIFDYSATKNVDALRNVGITVKDSLGNDVPFETFGTKIIVMYEDLMMGEDGAASISVSIQAQQELAEDVYFFSPEGGRSASQSRVAVFSGLAPVAAAVDFGMTRSNFEEADADAQLKVTKKVLLNGEAHRSEGIYYVALFEDEACTLPAFNGDVRAIRMGGEAEGSVVFDELMPGKTYYVSETDADGKPIKDGDMGIAVIAYDKKAATVDTEFVAEVTITNCYETEEPKEEPGGGIGDGGPDEPGDDDSIDEAVDTGDNTNIMMLMTMMMLMTLAMIGMVAVLLGRRRAA